MRAWLRTENVGYEEKHSCMQHCEYHQVFPADSLLTFTTAFNEFNRIIYNINETLFALTGHLGQRYDFVISLLQRYEGYEAMLQ